MILYFSTSLPLDFCLSSHLFVINFSMHPLFGVVSLRANPFFFLHGPLSMFDVALSLLQFHCIQFFFFVVVALSQHMNPLAYALTRGILLMVLLVAPILCMSLKLHRYTKSTNKKNICALGMVFATASAVHSLQNVIFPNGFPQWIYIYWRKLQQNI